MLGICTSRYRIEFPSACTDLARLMSKRGYKTMSMGPDAPLHSILGRADTDPARVLTSAMGVRKSNVLRPGSKHVSSIGTGQPAIKGRRKSEVDRVRCLTRLAVEVATPRTGSGASDASVRSVWRFICTMIHTRAL